MKKHIMPEMKEGGVNVTPLIDIVMCLIIFFMLVAKIGVTTGAEQMEIPASILGTDIKAMGNTLVLNVRPGPLEQPTVTALIKTDANPEPTKQEIKLVEPSTGRKPLLDVLKYYRKGNDEFKVIIRGEGDLAYRFLEP